MSRDHFKFINKAPKRLFQGLTCLRGVQCGFDSVVWAQAGPPSSPASARGGWGGIHRWQSPDSRPPLEAEVSGSQAGREVKVTCLWRSGVMSGLPQGCSPLHPKTVRASGTGEPCSDWSVDLILAALATVRLCVQGSSILGSAGTREKDHCGSSLVVQWLRLRAPDAGSASSILGQGTRSCKPQLRSGAAK